MGAMKLTFATIGRAFATSCGMTLRIKMGLRLLTDPFHECAHNLIWGILALAMKL